MAVVENTVGSDLGIDVGSIHEGPPAAAERSNGAIDEKNSMTREEEVKREVKQLQELLSKLNPMAEEFVPPSLVTNGVAVAGGGFYPNGFVMQNGFPNDGMSRIGGRRRRNGFGQGKRRINSRTSVAQREEVIRRTVYVSDIDQLVTEEELAMLFINCGQVVDCRVCGDPNSLLRFAFIEFTDEEGARAALNMSGTLLGFYPVKVLPSKTAIAPVDPKFLPRVRNIGSCSVARIAQDTKQSHQSCIALLQFNSYSEFFFVNAANIHCLLQSEDEREMCSRTIYCTNIDKKVTQSDVKLFFESICGPVYRLRLLGDYHHSTRIAFVEFVRAESAIAALNCSGAILGSLPLRVSPSKTPVRPRAPRPPMQ